LVEAGWNRLAPPKDAASVLTALRSSLGTAGKEFKPYGAGDAANRIVQRLMSDLN
jgi:UDP-GlcNAc3NAcA epimerase